MQTVIIHQIFLNRGECSQKTSPVLLIRASMKVRESDNDMDNDENIVLRIEHRCGGVIAVLVDALPERGYPVLRLSTPLVPYRHLSDENRSIESIEINYTKRATTSYQ